MGRIGIFDNDDKKEKWFQFDDDTEVKIKLVTKKELRDIAKKAVKRSKLTGQDVDDISDMLLGRFVVKGWRKIDAHDHPGFVVNDQPLVFSPESIDLLMSGSMKFSKFVNQMSIDEDEFMEDAETKNV